MKNNVKQHQLKKVGIAVAAALGVACGSTAWADNVATQTVNFEVQAIDELEVTGTPSLTISAATAGQAEPLVATDSSSTYAITTNAGTDAKKITAAINTAMPTNVTLKVNLTAPTGGSSPGNVTLTTSAADVVTSIDSVTQTGLGITYTLEANLAAGVVAPASKTVTFTLVNP